MAWANNGIPTESGGQDLGKRTASTLYKYATSDTPSQCRILRAGLRIRNTSSALNASGTVKVLQTSSPLNIIFPSVASSNIDMPTAASLISMVNSNPKSRTYTCSELCSGLNELVCAPATNVAYNSYGPGLFQNTTTDIGIQAQWNASETDMSFNNIVMVFSKTALQNNFEITLMSQNGFRYIGNELLNSLEKPAPTNVDIQKTHDLLQKQDGSLSTTILPYAPPPFLYVPTDKTKKPSAYDTFAQKQSGTGGMPTPKPRGRPPKATKKSSFSER